MVTKLVVSDVTSARDFLDFMSIWARHKSALLEFDMNSRAEKDRVFDLSIKFFPDAFAEAVADYFLEDEDFSIASEKIETVIEKGSIGILWSVFYRKNLSDELRARCVSALVMKGEVIK